MRITFESDTCGRCGGTGRMPFSNAGGVCFACGGSKTRLTRTGKAALKRFEQWAAQHLDRHALDLQPGDVVRVPTQFAGLNHVTFKRPLRVVSVAPYAPSPTLTEVVLHYRGRDFPWLRVDTAAQTLTIVEQRLRLVPTEAQLREVFPTLGKGATLVETEPAEVA